MVLLMIINVLLTVLVFYNKETESAQAFLEVVNSVLMSSCLLADLMELLIETYVN